MLCCHVGADESKHIQSRFYCCGIVPVLEEDLSQNLFEIRHGMLFQCEKKVKVGIEFGMEAEESDSDFGVRRIIDPDIPYFGDLTNSLYLGKTIQITGTIEPYAQSFVINLISSKVDDIGFHFNPRFDRRVVVRNARRKNSWGEEEVAAARTFPFVAGKNVVITIFVADGNFMVAVDNFHFCKFDFRLPIDQIRLLQITGDIKVKLIFIHNSDNYPTPVPSKLPRVIVPKSMYAPYPSIERKTEIKPGSKIKICGRVKLLPHSFYINLQVGSTIVPHPEIPFHMNLRLCLPGPRENQMICNSWHDGTWGKELKPDDCPFSPGMPFEVVIYYLMEGFNVSVNKEFLIAFPLRLSEPPNLDTILVEGDVIISKVKTKISKLVSAVS